MGYYDVDEGTCPYCKCINTDHIPDPTEPELFYCTKCRGACGKTSKDRGKYVYDYVSPPFGREPDAEFDSQFEYYYGIGA
jgi:hypothetical protein